MVRMTWRLKSEGGLHFQSWDEEVVVYNDLSGDTHLLGPVAAQILVELNTAPADKERLLSSLFMSCMSEVDGLEQELDIILQNLHALALIEAA